MPRILVIDDDPGMREMLEGILRLAGHETICAAHGQQGILLQCASPAALAIVDLIMPVKDGVATIHELLQTCPGLPIIAMTGHPNMGRVLRVAHRLGARRVLRKPFSPAELLAALASALATPTPAAAGGRPAAGSPPIRPAD